MWRNCYCTKRRYTFVRGVLLVLVAFLDVLSRSRVGAELSLYGNPVLRVILRCGPGEKRKA